MTARTRLLTAATLAMLTLGVAACGEDSTPEPSGPTANPPPVVTEPTTEPEPTDSPTPEESSPEPEPAPTEPTEPAGPTFGPSGTPQSGEPSGEPLLPVDLRVGEHEGYERVVLEMTGAGVPGWQVEYVEEAIEDGRGDRIDVDGDAILSVYVSGTRYPEEGEDHLAQVVREGEDVVEEVHYIGTFEGLTQLFIGVDDGAADFRVQALADPARLVIDIADPDDD